MLTLTSTAAEMLAQTRAQRGIPDDASLRVAPSPSSSTNGDSDEIGIMVSFVEQPEAGDQAGEAHGMPICVASEVAEALDGTAIDVEEAEGEARLVLVPAP